MGGTLLNGWHGHTLTDAELAQPRETAEQVARREAEAAADWDAWVDAALRLAGDHSMPLAVHAGRALRLIDKEDQ